MVHGRMGAGELDNDPHRYAAARARPSLASTTLDHAGHRQEEVALAVKRIVRLGT
jgi:hypothetical protein